MRNAAWVGLAALTIACAGDRASFQESEANKVSPSDAGAENDDRTRRDDDRDEGDGSADGPKGEGSEDDRSDSDAGHPDSTGTSTSAPPAESVPPDDLPPSSSEPQPGPSVSAQVRMDSADTPTTTAPTTDPTTTADSTVSASQTTDPGAPTASTGTTNPAAGGAAGTPPGGDATGGGGSAEPIPTDPNELVPPAWSAVPCTESNADAAGQGPFFIHDLESDEDISLFRQDIRGKYNSDAEDGIEMQLHLRVVGSSNDCSAAPIEDADIYVWHTDAQGYFSGFGMPGDQDPDQPYAGTPGTNDLENLDRFCRGAQTTNADGVVSFRTYFPGWMNGRDVHIHILALKHGSASKGRSTYSGSDVVFMTNLYFEPAFTDSVHQSAEPYKRRTALAAYQGAIKADEPGNSGVRATATFENGVVVAQLQLSVSN